MLVFKYKVLKIVYRDEIEDWCIELYVECSTIGMLIMNTIALPSAKIVDPEIINNS